MLLHVFILWSCDYRSSPDDPEVLGCYQKEWRKGDWAEKPQCKDVLEWHEEGDPGDFLYKENPDLQVYR